MTIEKMLENLEKQKGNIEFMIDYLKNEVNKIPVKKLASKIVESGKGKGKKLYWNQRPENRAKVLKMIRKAQKARRK